MPDVRFLDLAPAVESFRAAVLKGFTLPRKAIPCRFFYDEAGSRLFERICDLDEYYLTGTELELLSHHAEEMAGLIGPGAELIELGSGASRKVRGLLDALTNPAGYVGVDISRDHLLGATRTLAADYPRLSVSAVCADYTGRLALPTAPPCRAKDEAPARRVVFFPGSTLGNLGPSAARRLLATCARLVGPGGGLLLGVDLKKGAGTLQAAYDDRAGVTAAFNRNLIHRLNRELDGDADPDAFRHHAFYDHRLGRVEMHLVSRSNQTVTVAGRRFFLARGETLHTENSRKYAPHDVRRLAATAGFRSIRTWIDRRSLFSVHYLQAT